MKMKTAIDTICKPGLKLWSSNWFYLKPASELYVEGVFDYAELYVVPGTSQDFLEQWKEAKFPFFLHAPHSYSGLNFALKKFETANRTLITEVESFRIALNAGLTIFHPGTGGTIEETIRQIKTFKGEFPGLFKSAVIENKPKLGLNGEFCIGASAEEMKQILHETGLGFCLDFGHAVCYAAWKGVGYESILDQFLELQPSIFHLSDGDMNSAIDRHLNFGKGNFELEAMVSRIPSNACISIETPKETGADLRDFETDVTYLRNVCRRVRA